MLEQYSTDDGVSEVSHSIMPQLTLSNDHPPQFSIWNLSVLSSFSAGNSVEVDESLFQEMDDLELEDEEDDPDYNPANLDSD